MHRHYTKKDAEITRKCYAWKIATDHRVGNLILPFKGKIIMPIHDELYVEIKPRSWVMGSDFIANMTTPADDGKRYNVWFTPKNRWTNKSQDPSQPKSLTHKEAIDLLNDLTLGNPAAAPEFEIRELTIDGSVPTANAPITKSAGMNCSGSHCNEFNPYAEPNQANGSYLCYNCRKR